MGLRSPPWKLLNFIGSGGGRVGEELQPNHKSVLAALWCSNVQPWLRNTALLQEQTWFLPFLPPTSAHFWSELLLSLLPRAPESQILPAESWELYSTRLHEGLSAPLWGPASNTQHHVYRGVVRMEEEGRRVPAGRAAGAHQTWRTELSSTHSYGLVLLW